MNSKLKEMLQSVIQDALAPINEKLERLDNDVQAVKKDNSVIQQSVLELTGIVADVPLIKQSLLELTGIVAGVPLINQSLLELTGIVADVPLIKQAVLETNEAVKRVESTQERHEHIQEILSLRSIEQEATLKRIK